MDADSRFPCARLAVLVLAGAHCLSVSAGSLQNPDLVSAAGSGDLAAVTTLLNEGADVNYSRGDTGETALIAAASSGRIDVARALLAAGAKANSRDRGGSTALLRSVLDGKLEMVKVLLAAGADPDICAPTYAQCRGPLMVALAGSDLKMARALLEAGASVNTTTSYGATPLRFALWGGDSPERIAVVRDLLARGANVDAGYPPRYSIPARANAASAGNTAEVVITGIADGRNAEGTALGDLASTKNVELMKVLLAAGAQVDARQPGWRTPLMIAAIAGNATAVRLLLDAGADINARDSSDRTALDMALAGNRQEAAQLLRAAAAARAPR